MDRCQKTKSKGFTLIEVIAASAILALGVVVVAAITSRSVDSLRLNTEYARAWEILDRQLTVIDHVGIDNMAERRLTEGNFREGDTEYRWWLTITDDIYDQLRRVDIILTWERGGAARKISASTMFNGSSAIGQETTLPEEELGEDVILDSAGGI